MNARRSFDRNGVPYHREFLRENRQPRAANRGTPLWALTALFALAALFGAASGVNAADLATWLVMQPLWVVVCIGLVLGGAFVGLLIYLADAWPRKGP